MRRYPENRVVLHTGLYSKHAYDVCNAIVSHVFVYCIHHPHLTHADVMRNFQVFKSPTGEILLETVVHSVDAPLDENTWRMRLCETLVPCYNHTAYSTMSWTKYSPDDEHDLTGNAPYRGIQLTVANVKIVYHALLGSLGNQKETGFPSHLVDEMVGKPYDSVTAAAIMSLKAELSKNDSEIDKYKSRRAELVANLNSLRKMQINESFMYV